jgi:hypothetical protein
MSRGGGGSESSGSEILDGVLFHFFVTFLSCFGGAQVWMCMLGKEFWG